MIVANFLVNFRFFIFKMLKNRFMVYYRCPNCSINFRAFTSNTGLRNCRMCSQCVSPRHAVSKWNNYCATEFRIRWYSNYKYEKNDRSKSPNALAHVSLNGLPAGHERGLNAWYAEHHQQTEVWNVHLILFVEDIVWYIHINLCVIWFSL